jgi:hypothetical protein
MRKVIWSKNVKVGEHPRCGNFIWKMKEQGEALFHQWGRDTHSDEDGSFSTAIIELEDGTVKNIPAEHVRFISGPIEAKGE